MVFLRRGLALMGEGADVLMGGGLRLTARLRVTLLSDAYPFDAVARCRRRA